MFFLTFPDFLVGPAQSVPTISPTESPLSCVQRYKPDPSDQASETDDSGSECGCVCLKIEFVSQFSNEF